MIDPHPSEPDKALYLTVVPALVALGLVAVCLVGLSQWWRHRKASKFVWGVALTPLVLGVAGLGLARG